MIHVLHVTAKRINEILMGYLSLDVSNLIVIAFNTMA